WPILAGALLFGGATAAVVVPRFYGHKGLAHPPSASSGSAASAVEAQVLLRLCGSYTVGTQLAPNLVDAFLHSKGIDKTTTTRAANASQWTVAGSTPEDPRPLVLEIAGQGTPTAFEGLADGQCDVGMASRRIHPDEARRLRDKGLGDMM